MNEDVTSLLQELLSDDALGVVGVMSFEALLFLSGSQPWTLPWIYVAFAGISLPLRVLDFIRRKWIFFLFDFCYVSLYFETSGIHHPIHDRRRHTARAVLKLTRHCILRHNEIWELENYKIQENLDSF